MGIRLTFAHVFDILYARTQTSSISQKKKAKFAKKAKTVKANYEELSDAELSDEFNKDDFLITAYLQYLIFAYHLTIPEPPPTPDPTPEPMTPMTPSTTMTNDPSMSGMTPLLAANTGSFANIDSLDPNDTVHTQYTDTVSPSGPYSQNEEEQQYVENGDGDEAEEEDETKTKPRSRTIWERLLGAPPEEEDDGDEDGDENDEPTPEPTPEPEPEERIDRTGWSEESLEFEQKLDKMAKVILKAGPRFKEKIWVKFDRKGHGYMNMDKEMSRLLYAFFAFYVKMREKGKVAPKYSTLLPLLKSMCTDIKDMVNDDDEEFEDEENEFIMKEQFVRDIDKYLKRVAKDRLNLPDTPPPPDPMETENESEKVDGDGNGDGDGDNGTMEDNKGGDDDQNGDENGDEPTKEMDGDGDADVVEEEEPDASVREEEADPEMTPEPSQPNEMLPDETPEPEQLPEQTPEPELTPELTQSVRDSMTKSALHSKEKSKSKSKSRSIGLK